VTGEEAERMVVRCRAEGIHRPLSAEERFAAFCSTNRVPALFVALAVELRWGSFVEIGRTEARVGESAGSTIWWDESDLELPEGLPSSVYVRFSVYEDGGSCRGWGGGGAQAGRLRLVGHAGATVEGLRTADDGRGRGVPLTIHAPPVRGGRPTARGTLWVERCELLLEPRPLDDM
jgi:hypothetical protein